MQHQDCGSYLTLFSKATERSNIYVYIMFLFSNNVFQISANFLSNKEWINIVQTPHTEVVTFADFGSC